MKACTETGNNHSKNFSSMRLSAANLDVIAGAGHVDIPSRALLALPVKVLQFGTGVLLRALPDYLIDKANRSGMFNGRIAVVKSTTTGGIEDFASQDNLYTLCVRGSKSGAG